MTRLVANLTLTCAAQTVVLINGQEIKDYSFANGIFRTT